MLTSPHTEDVREPAAAAAAGSDDRSLWSTLGYDALALIWGIDTSALSEARKQALAAATIELREQRPDALSSLQREILDAPTDRRIDRLVARML